MTRIHLIVLLSTLLAALAQCGTSCPEGQISCGGKCVDPETDVKNCGTCDIDCTSTGWRAVCSAGLCRCASCAPTLTPCGQGTCPLCVDIQRDSNNCGACGVQCTVGTKCVSGKCA